MNIRHIKKLYEKGDVTLVGEKGAGKDMLVGNVIARRKLDYVSNVDYPKKYGLQYVRYPLDFDKLNVGENTYKDFISGNINAYKYPYPIGTDVYISDAGVYLPSQFCNELNRDYKHLATLMALSRHLGFSVHTNCQNINRVYDKIREQSRTYITALKCRVIPIFRHQIVIQKVRIYEKYDSCANNVPALKLPLWAYMGGDAMMARLYKLNYKVQHGEIKERTLIYLNRCSYNTHIFREILANGTKGVKYAKKENKS